MTNRNEDAITYYRNSLANFYEKKDYLRMILISEKIIDYYRKAPKGELYAEDMYNIACIYMDVNRFKEAYELLEEITSFIDEKRTSDKILLNIYNAKAVCFARNADFVNAENYFEKTLKLIENNKTLKNNPYVVQYDEIIHNLGSVKLDLGKYDEAAALFSEELALTDEKSFPHTDALILLAVVLENKKAYGESINCLQDAIRIIKKISGINSKEYMELIYYIAGVYYKNRDYNNSFVYFDKAGELVKKFLNERHPYYAEVLNKLSNVYIKLNNIEKAIVLRQKALSILKEVFGDLHVYYIYCLEKLAISFKIKGDQKVAISLIKQVLNIKEKINGKKSEGYIKTLLLLYNFCIDSGDAEQSIEILKEAFELSKKFPELNRDIKFYKIEAYIVGGYTKKAITAIKQHCRSKNFEYESFIDYLEKSVYVSQKDLEIIYDAFDVENEKRIVKVIPKRLNESIPNEIVGMFDGKSMGLANKSDKIIGSIIDIISAARKSNMDSNKFDEFIGGIERLTNSIMDQNDDELLDYMNEFDDDDDDDDEEDDDYDDFEGLSF